MRTCAVRLRAAPRPGDVSVSGCGAHDARAAGSGPPAHPAAGPVITQVVPWPVLVTKEWMAIVDWIKLGTWAIVLGVIIGILIGAVVMWRKSS